MSGGLKTEITNDSTALYIFNPPPFPPRSFYPLYRLE
jgi:hypothetical protein